ncbi:MAG: hypothetical protein ACK4RV_10190 [Caulobacter sp.]
MDLAQIDTTKAANEGAVLELLGPDEAPLVDENGAPVTITLLGKDSEVFNRETNARANRVLNQRGRQKITVEASRAEGVRLLAKCTVAWAGIKVRGEFLDCTYENALKLYTEFAFIREQVDAFIGDRSNFTKASSTS